MGTVLEYGFWLYLLGINLAAFLIYGADKWKARSGRWRVPEKTLFVLALLGGSIGALTGMKFFHHKTRKWYFRFGIPAILIAQLAIFFLLFVLYPVQYLPEGSFRPVPFITAR